jgi:metal-responsive CopG/Arc/MetJ family transcriptional regulator
MSIKAGGARRITISVREDVISTLDSHVASGVASSRTDLIATAIERELRRLRRVAVDAEILAAATNDVYGATDAGLAAEADDSETWAALDEIDGGYFSEPR